jgi:hypothetical protein
MNGTKSYFKPFFDVMLSDGVGHLPANFSNEEMEYLIGSDMKSHVYWGKKRAQ